MRTTQKKTTFGLIIGTRNIFNGSMAVDARADLMKVMGELDFNAIILPPEATPHGAVETRADAAAYVRLFKEHRDEIDGIVVILPNFGDEIGIVETVNGANLGVPVLVQASNDEVKKVDVLSRRDAFLWQDFGLQQSLSIWHPLHRYHIPYMRHRQCGIQG